MQAGAPQKRPDPRQYPRILFQFELPCPLHALGRMLVQVLPEQLFGILVHTAELPDPDASAARSLPGLTVKRRALAQQAYQTRQEENDGKAGKGQRNGERVIQRVLEP